jgi:hypothetical protein
MRELIKVGFCIAYDWELLQYSLPLIYKDADVICLSIDKDRISWAKEKYIFDEDKFQSLIKKIDIGNKIKILQDDFHLEHLSPPENEVRQRKRIAEFLGAGGWHMQLDCDEYFPEFERFVKFLHSLPARKTQYVNICCTIITLFKQIGEGFLIIKSDSKESTEFIQVASKNPAFEHGRRNGYFNIYTDFIILHQSWARSKTDIQDKIKNWGHKNDFDTEAYLRAWDSLNSSNYTALHNFHPIKPTLWSTLSLVRANDVIDLINNPPRVKLPWRKIDFILKNNRNISRLRNIWGKLFR